MKYCSVNGIEQKNIDITDRGLAYGDGIFTTAKIVNGKVLLLDKHLARLNLGCQALAIKAPLMALLTQQIAVVAKLYPLAVLKVIITAGSGGRGYSRVGLNDNATNVIIMVSDFPSHYASLVKQGINLGDSKQQISTSPMLAGIKHLNRLEQVLLRAELDDRLEDDLIVANSAGDVIEVTSSNLFYWLDGQLCSPDLSMSGVNGIIRQLLLEKYPQIKVRKTKFSDLKHTKAMFICNSLMGIMPVKTYNNRILTIDAVQDLQNQMKAII
ncbi:aminodeoxychorismate lyase [Colwellia piezophila]|uniref:aminodeoxychorismate lyase n=1 Tax=Colwellia piezophila TaxID=211668 RepID=UPI00035C09A6|nr:aminodeoxychorismate lyase [Colwellia piezophila]